MVVVWPVQRIFICVSVRPTTPQTQKGYLLARSAGDAEAVLEHIQPFFYECVPVPSCWFSHCCVDRRPGLETRT